MDSVEAPVPVEKQNEKETLEIPKRVKSALYEFLREKEIRIEQLLANKESTEKAITIFQEDIREINQFLGKGEQYSS